MYYTIVPDYILYEGMDKVNEKKYIEVNINNKIFILDKKSDNQYEIIRMISSNPADYLNASYAPGTIVNMNIDIK